jgi:tyrosinase
MLWIKFRILRWHQGVRNDENRKKYLCTFNVIINMEKDIIVRKNVKSLSPTEKKNFIDAIKALKANTKNKKLGDNRYDDYVIWHAQTMMVTAGTDPGTDRNLAHRGSIFLPWHREYLRRFEIDLQAEVPGVTIPYWDWAADAALFSTDDTPAWKKSPIWQEDFMGGDGDPENQNIVADGPFKDWITQEMDAEGKFSLKGRLTRSFGIDIPRLPTQMDVYNAFSLDFYDTPYWDAFSRGFRNALEGWPNGPQLHNRVHVWVGGSMELSTSPNDPVFFLNHCNVDRIWALWQDLRFNTGYPADGTIIDRKCKKIDHYNQNDKIYPWQDEADSKTIADVLDYRKLGYTYGR